jgi:hypothetical protein
VVDLSFSSWYEGEEHTAGNHWFQSYAAGVVEVPAERSAGMDYSVVRKLSLQVFIGFLALTAAIAIVSVLSGSFGDFQIKVLVTTFSISAAAICSMACAAFVERRRGRLLGLSGIAASVGGALLVIIGVWAEVDGDEYWKTTVTVTVVAVGLAHAFLLALPHLAASHRWVQAAAAVAIGVLSLMIVLAVWGEIEEEDYYRFLAAVSIVVVLLTLTIPILMKLGRFQMGGAGLPETLELTRVEGDTYAAADGRRFEVRALDAHADPP